MENNISATIHGIQKDCLDDQAIQRETINKIYYNPGTKLKLETGRKNHKSDFDERYHVRYCKVIKTYPEYILCEFNHSRGAYTESINKIDIACGQIKLSIVEGDI